MFGFEEDREMEDFGKRGGNARDVRIDFGTRKNKNRSAPTSGPTKERESRGRGRK